MIIKDKIYGDFKVDEVIFEIINTKAMQRLKGVYQGGASFLVNKKWDVTRYEHSIGVMLLIKLLNGSIEEQIAGLIHDISHTAFSHVVDVALNNKDEDYHEIIFDKVVKDSQIPSILIKYGYDLDKILDDKRWGILEKEAPKLCADRIDYTLRDMYHWGKINNDDINSFIDSLEVVNGEIVVNSISSSEWFVDLYYKEVIGYFRHPLNLYAYDRLSKALKISLENEEILLEDLINTDKEVLDILKSSNIEKVRELVHSLNYNVDIAKEGYAYEYSKGKLRKIDPTLYINKNLIASSQASEKVRKINDEVYK